MIYVTHQISQKPIRVNWRKSTPTYSTPHTGDNSSLLTLMSEQLRCWQSARGDVVPHLWRGDKSVRGRVSVVPGSEVSVEGRDDCVLLSLLHITPA